MLVNSLTSFGKINDEQKANYYFFSHVFKRGYDSHSFYFWKYVLKCHCKH